MSQCGNCVAVMLKIHITYVGTGISRSWKHYKQVLKATCVVKGLWQDKCVFSLVLQLLQWCAVSHCMNQTAACCFRIISVCGDFYIGGRQFESLEHLISYYTFRSCLLEVYITATVFFALPDFWVILARFIMP